MTERFERLIMRVLDEVEVNRQLKAKRAELRLPSKSLIVKIDSKIQEKEN